MKNKKVISIGSLSRVEGEGRFRLTVREKRVVDSQLNIFEPPRFFEAFLRGRKYDEAPDLTSRICGICPIAYQMSAAHAMEDAFGIRVVGPLREMRRLIYCGEWIESHALHIYMLQGPDFLGYEDGFRMGRDFPDELKRGLQLKKAGNEIVRLFGGRPIHPINARVGGFYGLPRSSELAELKERMKWAVEAALETVRWVAAFSFPDYEGDYEFLSLRHSDEYPFNEGRLVSSSGLDMALNEYETHFVETQVAHSTALQTRHRDGRSFFLGPLARLNLNFDRLSSLAKEALAAAMPVSGFKVGSRNPFHGIIARSIEVLQVCDEALRILSEYDPPLEPAVKIEPCAGIGYGCTEAPRGALYHRYEVDSEGLIVSAKIVPPTSQNQVEMEKDLRRWAEKCLREDSGLSEELLALSCEKLLRNYDPCISCSTHGM